jgi:hypothetical protein
MYPIITKATSNTNPVLIRVALEESMFDIKNPKLFYLGFYHLKAFD